MRFGFIHCAQDAIQNLVADRVHLGLEAEDRDAVAHVPLTHFAGLEHGLAVETFFAEQVVGEELAAVDRELGAGLVAAKRRRVDKRSASTIKRRIMNFGGCAIAYPPYICPLSRERTRGIRALLGMHPGTAWVGCPSWQRHRRHALARSDVGVYPARNLLPACGLPDLEG